MIYTERKVSIKNDKATMDSPIILFRGDREVEIMFTIVDSKFKFESNKGNVIDKTQAAFGQLAVALPDGTDLFTEIVECENGVVVFSITGEMIDEIHEVGFYSFHIRLYNDDKTSRITLPPVMKGIEIREPLIIEGDVENTDLVGDATVGYSMVQTAGVDEEVFDGDGNYIPTVWGIGDKITAEKLNKIEEGISGGKGSSDDLQEFFSYDPNLWGEAHSFNPGNLAVSNPILKFNHYRHDTINPIPVIPGSKLYVSGHDDNNSHIAILTLDSEKKCLADLGYVEGEIQLTEDTHYIILVLTTINYTDMSLLDKLSTNIISVKGHSYDIPRYIKRHSNVAITHKHGFVQGTIGYNATDKTLFNSDSSNTIRMINEISCCINNKPKILYYNIDSRFKICPFIYDGENWLLVDDWYQGSGVMYLPNNSIKMVYTIRRIDEGDICVDDIDDIYMTISDGICDIDEKSSMDISIVHDVVENIEVSSIFSTLPGSKFKFFGHSCMAQYAPENTVEGVKMSRLCGMDGIETDVLLTSDGHLVLMHDETVDRTTNGTGKVCDLSLEEIKSLLCDFNTRNFTACTVPTLDECLDACKEYGLQPMLEIKPFDNRVEIAEAMYHKLKDRGALYDCLLTCFHFDALECIRNKDKLIVLGFTTNKGDTITDNIISKIASLGNCFLFAYYGDLTSEIVKKCHNKNIPVISWTVDDPEIYRNQLAIGVDGIVTNKLINPNRHHVMKKLRLSSTDRFETITLTNILGANDFEITSTDKLDDYNLKLTLTEFDYNTLLNLNADIETSMIMNTNNYFTVLSYISTGGIICKFFKNGVQIPMSELPDYVHMNIKIIY